MWGKYGIYMDNVCNKLFVWILSQLTHPVIRTVISNWQLNYGINTHTHKHKGTPTYKQTTNTILFRWRVEWRNGVCVCKRGICFSKLFSHASFALFHPNTHDIQNDEQYTSSSSQFGPIGPTNIVWVRGIWEKDEIIYFCGWKIHNKTKQLNTHTFTNIIIRCVCVILCLLSNL